MVMEPTLTEFKNLLNNALNVGTTLVVFCAGPGIGLDDPSAATSTPLGRSGDNLALAPLPLAVLSGVLHVVVISSKLEVVLLPRDVPAHHKDFLGPEAAEETTEHQKNVTLRRDFKPSDDEFSTDQF
ncbi:hypothetical protein HGM15179_009556 [Zosterops borbonicus]|uniref:Uncharacterized protein n=1 Tax=Zosterops borbonicus TaxID=364589 RepID=A0A8K1GGL0_9PASS|nr:hypothetical protein HGM15179_009556 [Zosterops borbonicus]